MMKLEEEALLRCLRRSAAVAAAMLALCASAGASSETAPLPIAQEETVSIARTRIARRDLMSSCLGVSVSGEWMRQVKVGECFLNVRLHLAQGDQVVFKQSLMKTQEDGLRLVLRGRSEEDMLLQLDQGALDVLERLGVAEIAVTDQDLYVQATYLTEDLSMLRRVFGVEEEEILSVCGENNPVTAVSADGVRRYLTF